MIKLLTTCSFCSKKNTSKKVKCIIATKKAAICNNCIVEAINAAFKNARYS